jgi:NAD(P)-dependent dehydrogenase (short-subunit alcohol dehydrogenase family)
MSEPSLAGHLAVVTGARGRLGPVWCAALESAGMEVVRIDLEGGDGVDQADVTDAGALRAIRDRIRVPRVLVNNAGIDQPPDPAAAGGGVEAVSADDFLRVLDVNTRGTFVASQVFGPAMQAAGGGSIVNIGSLYASISPDPSFYDHIPGFLKPPAYGASKAGVVQLTRWLARHLAPVRVNALSPGGVRGDQDDEFLRKYTARVPLGRMAEPDDLTGPLLFLASDASRYVTGHEVRVDGGFLA